MTKTRNKPRHDADLEPLPQTTAVTAQKRAADPPGARSQNRTPRRRWTCPKCSAKRMLPVPDDD